MKEPQSKLMYPKGDGCYLQGISPQKVYLAKDYEALQKENEELKEKLDIEFGQELFNVLADICDFNALQDDMRAIISAVKRDNGLNQEKLKH